MLKWGKEEKSEKTCYWKQKWDCPGLRAKKCGHPVEAGK